MRILGARRGEELNDTIFERRAAVPSVEPRFEFGRHDR